MEHPIISNETKALRTENQIITILKNVFYDIDVLYQPFHFNKTFINVAWSTAHGIDKAQCETLIELVDLLHGQARYDYRRCLWLATIPVFKAYTDDVDGAVFIPTTIKK